MQKSYGLNAFSYEAREFADNVLRASKNFLKLASLSADAFLAFAGRPKLMKKVGPGVFEEVEPGPPPGPHPWASPPGRMF